MSIAKFLTKEVKPINLETRYRIETGCRPFYSGKRPTYGFMFWLDNKRITEKERSKYSKHYGLFMTEEKKLKNFITYFNRNKEKFKKGELENGKLLA